ncbi:MAG: hypothetical protein EBU90_27195 [Proteobacteria bacterium]|nr:hypothetical protein [Pseudomonadota bacterium]
MKVVEGNIYDDTLKLHIIDLILKDVGTAGYTEYDWGTTLAEYFEENEDKWPVMFFSIHSHHNMGVTPSGVDDKHLYDNISNFPFHLSVIVNNKLDFNARIATDMVIESVSVRGMDSAYSSRQINDGRIIVEYSIPVSLSSANNDEFKEEFERVQAEKRIIPNIPSTYERRTGQQVIPFGSNTIRNITQYSLGTLNYKVTTLKEVLAEIKTNAHVEKYLDEIEKICINYVDAGMTSQVKRALSELNQTFVDIAPNHKFLNDICYGLDSIDSIIDDVQDIHDVPFGNNNKKHKDISRMTDKEWEEYISDRRY